MASTPELELLCSVAERTGRFRFGTWYWGDAIAIDGLLEADRVIGGRNSDVVGPHRDTVARHRDAVVSCLDHSARSAPTTFDDALVPGRAVLRLVADGSLPRAAADRVVASLERLPLFDGAIPALEPHRPQFRFGVCIDALYHLPAMMLLAGEHRGDRDAGRTAIRVATEILEVLRCPTGWAQWYDFSLAKNNAISCGRGLGWAVLGLLDLLALVDHGAAGNLVEAAGTILEALADSQAPSGHWPAVLADPRAAEDTSTAAFFVAAALHPEARAMRLPVRGKGRSCDGSGVERRRRGRHLRGSQRRCPARVGSGQLRAVQGRAVPLGPGRGAPGSGGARLRLEVAGRRQTLRSRAATR